MFGPDTKKQKKEKNKKRGGKKRNARLEPLEGFLCLLDRAARHRRLLFRSTRLRARHQVSLSLDDKEEEKQLRAGENQPKRSSTYRAVKLTTDR